MGMSNKNLGKNSWAAKRHPGNNRMSRGTMNRGNSFAIPWETNNLVFRTYEEGNQVVEAVIRDVEAILAEDGDPKRTLRIAHADRLENASVTESVAKDPGFQAIAAEIRHAGKTGDRAKVIGARRKLREWASANGVDVNTTPEVLDLLEDVRRPRRK